MHKHYSTLLESVNKRFEFVCSLTLIVPKACLDSHKSIYYGLSFHSNVEDCNRKMKVQIPRNCKLCAIWMKKKYFCINTVLLSGSLNFDSFKFFVIYSKSLQGSYRNLGFSYARSGRLLRASIVNSPIKWNTIRVADGLL